LNRLPVRITGLIAIFLRLDQTRKSCSFCLIFSSVWHYGSGWFSEYFLFENTSRNPEKTDGIFPSLIITDGNNSVSKSVGIYQRPSSVGEMVGIYRWNISVGIYRPFLRRSIQFVWKDATAWWRAVFSDDFTDRMTEGFKLR